jgi:hypothetical protein
MPEKCALTSRVESHDDTSGVPLMQEDRMMFAAQAHDLRGDRGGKKDKKKPKAQKPGKGSKTRESLIPASTPKPAGAGRPAKESGSDEK